MINFTEKQKQEIKALKNNEFKRINIYDGSVRSGKTWISCVIWCLWVASRKGDDNFLMCAKNLTALKRNVLEVCIDIFGSDNISYSLNQKTASIFGKVVYLEGANDSRAETKIRGMTLKGAYCDELSLFPHDFFKMLLSRLSIKNAKLFGTTNPDSPNHWLYKDFLTNDKISMRNTKFLIDDNTTLDQQYIANLKTEFNGVFYDRFILGKWVVAEGSIYSIFTNNKEKYISNNVDPNSFIQIGVDFGGNKSGHAFTATAISKNRKQIHVLKSDWIQATGIDPTELDNLFVNFIRDIQDIYHEIPIKAIYCDSAEQVLINGFRTRLKSEKINISILNALKGTILNRIKLVLRLLALDRIKFTVDCNPLIDGLEQAVYDDNENRLDDGTVNIDSIDSFEYSFESVGKILSVG